ncbi:MFS transporter [Pseudomonas asiatica]|uniref:MFS transporter n=1 Tax=Pseudomonas asiatica TaxID=2219225 RepID=UPI00345AA2ED
MKSTIDASSWNLAESSAINRVLFRKIALRVIPLIFVAYIFAFLDRVNIGYAKLQMLPDLGLTEGQYGFAAGIFFIGYALFEIPSNLLLDKIGARKTMTRIMVLWGIASAATMFVTTAQQLYILRLLLGIFEAGFFPGVILYLSFWFPSYMRGRVTGTLLLATLVAPILGGPISGLIMESMNGVSGLAGWRWLFLLEAVPIIFIGIACFLLLCDKPEQAQWLTEDEKILHTELMARDRATLDPEQVNPHSGEAIFSALIDPKVYVLAFLYFSSALGTYAFNFWLPTTIQKLGVSSITHISLYAMIPFTCAALGMIIIGRSSDLRRERRLHYCISILFGALMLALSTLSTSLPLSLALLGGAAFGFSGAIIVCWAIPATYLKGRSAPAGIALVSSLGSLCGFAAPSIIGVARELTGKDHAGMYAISLIMVIAAVCMLTLMPKHALAVGKPD